MIDTSLLTLTKAKEKRSMSKLYIPQGNKKKSFSKTENHH